MARQMLISLDKTRIAVAPGASVELAVTIQNLTALLDQVAVRLEGIDPGWVQVVPPVLPVFAQNRATTRVIIRPPRDPSRAVAGIWPLQVHATSQEHPDEKAEAEAELEIQFVGDYRLRLDRAIMRDDLEASYPLGVENNANAPLNLRLAGDDAAFGLWYKFNPFQVTAPPGGETVGTVAVRSKRGGKEIPAADFRISSQGEYVIKGGSLVAAPPQQIVGRFGAASPAVPQEVVGEFVAAPAISISLRAVVGAESGEGSFEVHIANPGPDPIHVQLSASDEGNRLEYKFQSVPVAIGRPRRGPRFIDRQAEDLAAGGANILAGFPSDSLDNRRHPADSLCTGELRRD